MAFFPMFMRMDGVKVLVVGGGAIAHEKLEKLIDFTAETLSSKGGNAALFIYLKL